MNSLSKKTVVYIGTYTRTGVSKGIYRCLLDSDTGTLSVPELLCEIRKPSFLAFHPGKKCVYSVTEGSLGSVTAFHVNHNTGKLDFLNKVHSGGEGPCHLTIDRSGNFLLTANYVSGSAAVLPVLPDGSLGEPVSVVQHSGYGMNSERQTAPHAHSINVSFDNRFVFVADLGIDKLMIYKFDTEKQSLTPAETPFFQADSGAGPRHFSFHPSGDYAYLINELDNTLYALSYDASNGRFERIQRVSILPDDFSGVSLAAEVCVHPDGDFLYASNRGHDSIAVFAVNQVDGTIELRCFVTDGIDEPRHFNIDPTGRWLIVGSQDTDSIHLFRIGPDGIPVPTGISHTVGQPICIKFAE